MPIAVQAGLLLGGLVAVWTFVMGFTGWYRTQRSSGSSSW